MDNYGNSAVSPLNMFLRSYEEVMQNLLNYGVVIVPNVLNEEECSCTCIVG